MYVLNTPEVMVGRHKSVENDIQRSEHKTKDAYLIRHALQETRNKLRQPPDGHQNNV